MVNVARTGSQRSGRIPELDGLRGVLAWTVVATHIFFCCGWFGPNIGMQNIPSETAAAAVDVFIILSGFAITRLLLVEQEEYRPYLFRRACRIVPVYWAALAFAIALNAQMGANFRHLPPTPAAQFFAAFSDIGARRIWTDAILHFFLLHGLAPSALLPSAPYTFLGVAWSLSLEWQFYCIAPLAVVFACRRQFGLPILVITCAATALFSGAILTAFSPAFLPAKAIFFLAGALTYVGVFEQPNRLKASGVLVGSCVALVILWWVGCGRSIEAMAAASSWLLVVAAARFGYLRPVSRVLNSPLLQFLGRISYSTYLFHAPIITLVQAGIWRWINPQDPTALLILTAIPSIPATLLVSELSWRWIERPFQRLGREFTFRRLTANPALR